MKLPSSTRMVPYLWPALLVLFVVVVGSWSAAVLQARNADQLVNGFLFETSQTFREAIFPLEHTQLLKWSLFVLLRYGHFAPALYVVLTIAVTVAAIAGLLYVLYGISKRTAVFGVLCVLLASTVLLIPTQAFDGGVAAPLGMAMLTGRNIEYIAYLGVLALYLKADSLRSWQWAGGALLLSLLFASDKLFAYFGFGGALLFGAAALYIRKAAFKRLARYWLAGTVTAWAFSLLWLAIIGQKLTQVVSYPLGYQHVASPVGLWQGVVGTLQALALNFGLTTRAGVGSLPAAALNFVTAGLIVYAAAWVVRRLYKSRTQSDELPAAMSFAAMLIATAVAAMAGCVLTSQPYIQNARYLTISLFAGFVVLAVWLRSVRLPRMLPLTLAGVCAVVLAIAATVQHNNNLSAHDTLAGRNQKIAAILRQHHVAFLVGNYWRVMPIRALTPQAAQAISPLQGCMQKTAVLTSRTWRPELLTHSFAYLLTTQSSRGVPQQTCFKRQLVQYYGPPTSEVVIAGDDKFPHEELLFYDDGAASKRPPATGAHLPSQYSAPQHSAGRLPSGQ